VICVGEEDGVVVCADGDGVRVDRKMTVVILFLVA
jgi:hypothetical protein